MTKATSLLVLATPIGNLADMSTRATATLRDADIICCEDTRHSKPLVLHAGGRAELWSCHAHNERERVADVVAALQDSKRVVLITDAGAPAVSDPGGHVVEGVIAAGLTVEVIPGPSAVIAALMGAGIDAGSFAFVGFLPRKGGERRSRVELAMQAGLALVLFEAPNRVADTLDDLLAWCGPRRVVVARELTKMHETFHRGVLGGELSPSFVEKGEAVIIIEAAAPTQRVTYQDDPSLPTKERARRLAAAEGIPVRDAYQRIMTASQPSAKHSALQDAQQSLRDTVAAMTKAMGHSDVADHPDLPPGAPQLASLLAAQMTLRAPVEARAVLESLLRTSHDLDALLEALEDS
jgi:16S rRNA (cytidine1402-2'-O)-methyltransferase